MFGFLNLMLAVAFLRAGMDDAEVTRVLEEGDPEAIQADDAGITWRGRRLDLAALARCQAAGDDLVRLLFLHRADRRSRGPGVAGARSSPDVNETHDPARRSWVESAQGHPDFPIQNLPFGVFRRGGGPPSVGIAIGDQILDPAAAAAQFTGVAAAAARACESGSLNALMALGPRPLDRAAAGGQRVPRSGLAGLPVRPAGGRTGSGPHGSRPSCCCRRSVGDYTDFYASVHHATNVGSMFRPDNPLLPNYKWVPIGYHGRASSMVASGTAVRRPRGQIKDATAEAPVFGPTRALDYEMEVGCFVGSGNQLGQPVPIGDGGRASVRSVPGERLVGPRHPDLGVPAAGTVPLQELCHHGLSLGGHAGGAGAVPDSGVRAPGRRSRAASLPGLGRQPGAGRCGPDRRGLAPDRARCALPAFRSSG